MAESTEPTEVAEVSEATVPIEPGAWVRRIHDAEGTVRYDAHPFTITPHKGQIHVQGSVRRDLGWSQSLDLKLNGIDLGEPPEHLKWDGGGMGWPITPEQIDSLLGRGRQSNDALRDVREKLDAAPRPRLEPDGTVSFMGLSFPASFEWGNDYTTEFRTEPSFDGLELFADPEPATYEQAVERQGRLFDEHSTFKNSYHYLQASMRRAQQWGENGEAYRQNVRRWRLLDPLYEAALDRAGDQCEEIWRREDAERKASEQAAQEAREKRERERWERLTPEQQEREKRQAERQRQAVVDADQRIQDIRRRIARMNDAEYAEYLRADNWTEDQIRELVAERAAWSIERYHDYLVQGGFGTDERARLVAAWPGKRA